MKDQTNLQTKHTIAELNQLYFDGDACDQQIFAEMRSNLLLVDGEHYQRRQSYFYKRIRDSRELSHEQKMRLTKNHIQKITKTYANNILSMNPGVGFSPKQDGDMHQQKLCDMDHSLWRDAVERYNIDDLQDDWCDSFIGIGEVAVKVFFDSGAGPVVGYTNKLDLTTGQPMLDDTGQPVPDMDKPQYKGEMVFEEIYGFNLLRPSECKDIRKAAWLGIRKMVDKQDLMGKFTDPEVQKFIVPAADETFIIFDGALGGYKRAKNQVMVREYYFRPSWKYPQGHYYITTKEGILAEGDLPGGLFPIKIAPMDKVPTTPRGRSIVRQMRPYQVEINRSASKMAEHQVTLGDDKLLIQNGTKVSPGVALPGVRSVNYTGAPPIIMEGRSGNQYLDYMLSQVKELYDVMNVAEDSVQAPTGQMDVYTLLFRSARQKKVFQRYIKRFEKFLIEIVKLYLRLCKIHYNDQELIDAIGKKEQVNIQELRQSSDLDANIKVEPQSDDIETKMGKQLVLNHILQYVGPQLKPEEIGKLLRAMPYADSDESFDDFTLDFDMARNEMLALDRGEQPPVHESDNHAYLAKKLLARTKKPDFNYLSPFIQQNYKEKLAVHQQIDCLPEIANSKS